MACTKENRNSDPNLANERWHTFPALISAVLSILGFFSLLVYLICPVKSAIAGETILATPDTGSETKAAAKPKLSLHTTKMLVRYIDENSGGFSEPVFMTCFGVLVREIGDGNFKNADRLAKELERALKYDGDELELLAYPFEAEDLRAFFSKIQNTIESRDKLGTTILEYLAGGKPAGIDGFIRAYTTDDARKQKLLETARRATVPLDKINSLIEAVEEELLIRPDYKAQQKLIIEYGLKEPDFDDEG
jgi:hypothetical protein